MTTAIQANMIAQAVHINLISEEEAIELWVAIKHGDHEGINKLMEEHKKGLDKGIMS